MKQIISRKGCGKLWKTKDSFMEYYCTGKAGFTCEKCLAQNKNEGDKND